jgi:hypothetical protein
MTVKHLFEIGCQLFNIKTNYYQLMYSDYVMNDDNMSLEEIDSSMTDTEFKLVCKATLNSSIKYLNQTIVFPCAN